MRLKLPYKKFTFYSFYLGSLTQVTFFGLALNWKKTVEVLLFLPLLGMTLWWLEDLTVGTTWLTLRSTTLRLESGGRDQICLIQFSTCLLCNMKTLFCWWEDGILVVNILTPFTNTTRPQRPGSSEKRDSPIQEASWVQFWQVLRQLNATDASNAVTEYNYFFWIVTGIVL